MDFHPKSFYRCPSCEMIFSYFAASSVNNFGSTMYSDGYERGMMLFENQEIVKCRECKTFYWIDKDNFVGYIYDDIIKKLDCIDAPPAKDLNFKDIKKAIKDELYRSNYEEKCLREILWRGFNDRVRCQENIFTLKTDEKLYTENCKRLIELYDKNDTEQMHLAAELLRNIGDFDGCKSVLKAIPFLFFGWQDHDYLKTIRKLLLRECNRKNKLVIMVKRHGEMLK